MPARAPQESRPPLICWKRPSASRIQTFLASQRGLPFSYPAGEGSFEEPPAGFVRDHHAVKLGEGPQVYDRACEAVRGWAMSRIGWVEVWPEQATVEDGAVVALLGHVFGVWCLFACRIVRVVEGHGASETFEFSYGTLPGHMLCGEERFRVRWDRDEGSVWYELDAFSRPATVTGRLAYPMVRAIQKRFGPDSLRSMIRAVEGRER